MNQIYCARRYFRQEDWTPEKLRRKIGRLSVRLIVADACFNEKVGRHVLPPAMIEGLYTLLSGLADSDIQSGKPRAKKARRKRSA